MASNDAYAFWRASRLDPRAPRTVDPQPGLWKARIVKGGELVSMQIWLEDPAGAVSHVSGYGMALAGTIDGKPATLAQLERTWLYCLAVSSADTAHHAATGRWPGEVGHNSGALSLTDEIADVVEQSATWLKKLGGAISTKLQSDMAANWRSSLLALTKRANSEREAEKAPHAEAARAVDQKFKPLIDAADRQLADLRAALTLWLAAEEGRLRAEADRTHRERVAAAVVERDRVALEHAVLMERDPIAALTTPGPVLLAIPTAPDPVRVQAGGQAGRKTGLRTIVRYEITDYPAVLAAVRDDPAVVEAVRKVATAWAKAGQSVSGLTKHEDKVAA